ncbi:MAG: iron-containing alcohol dehydrogenase, partial [Candidatus Lokiarchaeota archaeon]|nr:iron-containing alcohol dehydrogenase [Candidatus Lokiarchaeota archaeon]
MPEPFIKIRYGSDLAVKSINDLKNYTAVVADPPWRNFKQRINNYPHETIIAENVDIDHLNDLANKPHDCSEVVGLGGGVAIDTSKYLSWKWNIPVIRIPSIISADAFLTREIGVRDQHRVRYIGKSEPNNIIIDYNLIRGAPPKYNYAGTCDVLSICTALGDWKIGKEIFHDPFDKGIFNKAYRLAKKMLRNPHKVKALSNDGIKFLVECLKEECYICEDWGNARPEEGSEHHLAYCIERISPKLYLHGSLVGLNILTVLKLQGSYRVFSVDELKTYFDEIGHHYLASQIGLSRETYKKALKYIQEYVKLEKLEHGLW